MARPRKNAVKAQYSLVKTEEVIEIPVEEQPYPLPEGWKWVRLSSLCSLRNGKAFKPSDWSDSGLPIVRIQNLNNPDSKFNYYNGHVEDKFLIKSGDLLFAWSGTPGTSFGAHIWLGEKAVLNQHIFRMDFEEKIILKSFFRYSINCRLEELISKAHGGAGLQHITKGVFESTPIALPTLTEQQRIVDRIESLFAKLDDAKAKAEAVLEGFEIRKAAILHKAFTGELTAKWREKKEESFDYWKKTPLGKILKVASGKGLTSKNMDLGGKIPVYGGNGITGYHNQSNVAKDTIVIGRVGYYCGSVYYVKKEAWVTDNALIVSFDKKKFDVFFIFYLLLYTNLRQDGSSTAQPVISGSKIYPIEVTIMPLPEQQEIVRILDNLLAKEQRVKESAENVLNQIDLMKKAILAKAFRGELGTHIPSQTNPQRN